MAITASHAYQIRRFDIPGILKVLFQRPLRFVKLRISELSQPHDPSRFSGHVRQVRGVAFVKPKTVLIWTLRSAATGLRYRAEIAETAAITVRVDVLQQVGCSICDDGDLTPQALVTGGPEIPRITALAFQLSKLCPACIVGIVTVATFLVNWILRESMQGQEQCADEKNGC